MSDYLYHIALTIAGVNILATALPSYMQLKMVFNFLAF